MFDELASEMCHVHNMVLRGLNSIYLQAPHITPADEKPFCRYVLGWYNLLHSHHSGEEADFFPTVEKMTGVKGLMDNNVDQHKAFHDGMDSLKAFADAVVADKEKYDASRLVTLIDDFGPALTQHLGDEIPTILSLRQYGEKMAGLPKAFDEEGEKAMVCEPLYHDAETKCYDTDTRTERARPERHALVLCQHRPGVRKRHVAELAPCPGTCQAVSKIRLLVVEPRSQEVWRR